ncbi:MAG TPA: MFS transporter [Chroococcales cyanobacterium]
MPEKLAIYLIRVTKVTFTGNESESRQEINQTGAADAPKAPGMAKASRKALMLIFFTVFIDLVGFGLIIPVLPTYAKQMQAPDWQIGCLLASYSVMQFLLMPFWGRLSDKVGRRPVLLISLTASVAGYVIWGLSNSLPMLFLSRIIAGAGNANLAVAQAYVADVTTSEDRAKGMGMVGAAFGAGFTVGPAIGGFCVQYGLQTIGFIAAAISLIDLVMTALILKEPEKRSQAGNDRYGMGLGFYFQTLANARFQNSLIIFLLSTFAFACMESTLVLLTQEKMNFSAHDNSLMFTYIGVLIVLVQGGLIRRLTKKNMETRLIGAGALILAVGLFLTPYMPNWIALYGALALLALGSGINTPANQSLLSKLAENEAMGGVLGVGQSLSTLGRILGPLIACAMFEFSGQASPYLMAGAIMLLVCALSTRLPKPAI